ncbi:MAG: cardiolipin synthase [Flavobacteriales bacterium]|nr:cardiolipin synthase [Flavobacteriales bacterium]
MDQMIIVEVAYILLLLFTFYRIIYDTERTAKVYAYLMLVLMVPVLGIIFYFSFGVNYRNRKMFERKSIGNQKLEEVMSEDLHAHTEGLIDRYLGENNDTRKMARLLLNDRLSPLTHGNTVDVLINGEDKYQRLRDDLKAAKDHIHMEYYIWKDDVIGNELKDILIQKAQEGVTVRVIYDDFGSRGIKGRMEKELKQAGADVFPFYSIKFYLLASRINYRNHRKIAIIDGKVAYTGGINISEEYVNDRGFEQGYWRDTHLRIEGPGVAYLQYLFFSDWNFSAEEALPFESHFFPDDLGSAKTDRDVMVQIAASGPDSERPTILYSLMKAIESADEELLITTPYFVPTRAMLDGLIMAALGGVDVKILLPEKSDSRMVDLVGRSYFKQLLKAGVKIYLYTKGMIHAKTMVVDGQLSIVGTANLDIRSFDLNFEVNAIVYDENVSDDLRKAFQNDLEDSMLIDCDRWCDRSVFKEMVERIARLLSPIM